VTVTDYRSMLMQSAGYAVSICPSIWLSVARVLLSHRGLYEAVVKANYQSNGNGQIRLPPRNSKTPERISMKLGMYAVGHKKEPT